MGKSTEMFDPETGELVLDELGREVPDPTPVAPPIGYVRQPSLAEQIRAMVMSEQLRQAAENAGAETFEESEDFDVGDDFDPTTPYENEFDPPVSQLQADIDAAKQETVRQDQNQTTAPSTPTVTQPEGGTTPSSPTPAS